VVSAAVETAHDLEHSIANAALPNVARIEACAAKGVALGRLVRRVDVIVCATSVAERVQGLVGPTIPVIIDDRALNQRAIQMLGAILMDGDGVGLPGAPPPTRTRLRPRAFQGVRRDGGPGRMAKGRPSRGSATNPTKGEAP
jgi:hypothetical protein